MSKTQNGMSKTKNVKRNNVSRITVHASRITHHSSLPGPEDIYRAPLPNGTILLTRANFNSPSVVISGYIQSGSLFDTDEKLGLADFTASALMRGSTLRDFQQIYNALESCGASLSFSAGAHTAGFSGRSLAEDLPLLLNTLAEVVRQPAFPSEQVEKLRAQLLTGLAIRAQDTADMAALTFDQILFAGHPYGRPEDGFPETIQAIRRQDLVDFHRQYYGPRGMVIAIVGAIEPQEAMDQAQRVLGDWNNGGQPDSPSLPPLTPMKETLTRRVTIAGKSQSDLVIGVSGPARRDPEYLPASLGNSVLGQFGMMGRIGDVVREKSGLAYYAYSSLNAGVGPGSWEISAGVNPGNLEKAADLIRGEIARFIEKGVTAEELADSQANFIGRLPLSLESNAGVAGALLNIERFNLGLDYYRRFADLVRAVTPDEVLLTARKFFHPERLAISIAGP
ncbi:MAG: pitrilysin family protein [Anaerolineales bacterium]|nr:pitrilysin family protein [Anaerolineales bacterium]